jgi:hypothetical protein
MLSTGFGSRIGEALSTAARVDTKVEQTVFKCYMAVSVVLRSLLLSVGASFV